MSSPDQFGKPTTYYRVDKTHADAATVTGNFNGELLHDDGEYSTHIAPAFHVDEGSASRRASKEGQGDIVIEGISREGWLQVTTLINGLGDEVTGRQIENAIIERLDWITWDRPSSGH